MKLTDPTSPTEAALNTLGERIKTVRIAWGWSQEEMADALRVDQASISFWERDKITPSGSAMVALAALFRTSIEALETGQDFQVPDSPSQAANGKGERKPLRSLSLPQTEGEHVMVVDVTNGAAKGKPLSEVMVVLVEAVKEGRKVWIVME